MMKKFVFVILLCVGGCAQVQLSPEDLEYRRQLVHEAWLDCRAIYASSGAVWIRQFPYNRGVELGVIRPPMPELYIELSINACHRYVPAWDWPPKKKEDNGDE